MFSCPTQSILAPKKVDEKDKSKKETLSCMYDYFYAHLVVINLKTQASNMHGKMKQQLPFIYTDENNKLFNDSYLTSTRSVKDMET